MIINFVSSSSRGLTQRPELSKLINGLANELAEIYDVRDNIATMYFLRDADGQELFGKFLKDKYNLNVRFWSFGDDKEHPIAAGFEISEDAAFTKLMLEKT